MVKVESFELDHLKVQAPYVRKCTVLQGKLGDKVSKFDLRFSEPNKWELSTAAMHTLEHLLAVFLREELDGVIDLSPMGCRTGFYLTLWDDIDEEKVLVALENSLKKVIEAKEVPALNPKQCGNYKDHSLFSAKEYAKIVLDSELKVLK